jgi:hypothetical protein
MLIQRGRAGRETRDMGPARAGVPGVSASLPAVLGRGTGYGWSGLDRLLRQVKWPNESTSLNPKTRRSERSRMRTTANERLSVAQSAALLPRRGQNSSNLTPPLDSKLHGVPSQSMVLMPWCTPRCTPRTDGCRGWLGWRHRRRRPQLSARRSACVPNSPRAGLGVTH